MTAPVVDHGIVRTHPLWLPFAPGANLARQGARVAHRQVAPGPPQHSRVGGDGAFETMSPPRQDARAAAHRSHTTVASRGSAPIGAVVRSASALSITREK